MSSNNKSSLLRRASQSVVAEMMESRRMFALVQGTSGDDVLVIDTFSYNLNGTDVSANTFVNTFNMLGGNDTITIVTGNFGISVNGGSGNDTLIGGSQADTLEGGEGNDSLKGNGGNDTYYFFDKLTATAETDTIDEPVGNGSLDTFAFYDASGAVQINLTSTTMGKQTNRTILSTDSGAGMERVFGSAGADSIMGNAAENTIFGYGDNDTIKGLGGNDNINGNDGNDLLFGGSEDDTIFGENNDDTLVGEAGTDELDGGSGTNQLYQDSLPLPEIFVEGDGGGIADGDTTPSVDDFTDFGTLAAGASKSFTYFVFNDGDGPLNTLGLKVVDSSNVTSTKFTITEPLDATIAPGGFDTFTVKFTSLNAGIFTHIVTFNNNDTDESPYNFAVRGTVQGTTTAPEVDVQGNSVSITDGDTTPSTTDATDFGTTTSGVAISKTFTVKNTGNAALSTSGLKVTTTAGAAITAFSITEGLNASIPAGGSDTFTVKFQSTVAGTQTAMVSFANNDSNENPYNYYIKATVGTAAAAPEADVSGNGIAIADGDTTPSTADFTDFGTVKPNVAVSKIFTVKNTGNKTLTTSGLKCVTTAGAASSSFVITEGLSASIAPGASDTFTVKFVSATLGSVTRMLTFANNDSNENPYNFYVKANVANTTTGSPEAEVRGNNVIIVDGDTTPTSGDFTNFGSKSTTATITKTFTVKNTGSAALITSGLKIVTTAGVASSTFSVIEGLSASIAAGASDTFTIKFVATTKGSYTRMITFVTNDSNENPYNFYISGTVV